MTHRVVFDTNTVVSALLFSKGRLAWLRTRWRSGECTPLISRTTAAEFHRALSYPKFDLTPDERIELLGDYLPFCEVVEDIKKSCPRTCRDPLDQTFLDLSFSAKADVLVTGDTDLLVLSGGTPFAIETAESYRQRCEK